MKLVRWGSVGAERPGLIDGDGQIRDLSQLVDDITGSELSEDITARIAAEDISRFPVVPAGTRLGPCIGNVGKIVCIGLNYRDHAREAKLAIPAEPIIFFKATSAIVGAHDPIVIPSHAGKVDWEVELGVVIGKTARCVSPPNSLEHVAGYCIVNDVSERAWQMERGGQWDKGKSADTFAPVGPWLVTQDDVPDPQQLSLWLEVDGVRRQDGTTADMIFGVAELISYVSHFMSLHPGDIIATGTPAGVGMGFAPPVYLRAGQTLCCGIDGLGVQQNPVQAMA